jgi:hypothetical protein
MPDDTPQKDNPDWFDEFMGDIDKAYIDITSTEDKKKPDTGDTKKKPE